jgi:hypothetical protein
VRYNVTLTKLKRWSGRPCSWEWRVLGVGTTFSTSGYAGWKWSARWGVRSAIRNHENGKQEIKYTVDTDDDV